MVLQKTVSIVLLILSLTAHVKSQTCESIYPYSPCSSNAACGCMQLAIVDGVGICGLSGVSCTRLSPCDADYSCQSANQMCVSHSRCGSTPLCYPMSMADPRLCPPMTTSTTMTTTTATANPTYFPMNTTGYYFNFTTNSTYPANWVTSTYSSDLTIYSYMNPTNNKYYQAIAIYVSTSSYYTIQSMSNMDTYGCLYNGFYNLWDSANATSCNDDHNGNQFQLDVYLEAGVSYTLLFTTYASNVTGSFTVVARGAGIVQFYTMYIAQDSTTPFPTYSTATESATTYGSSAMSIYSGILSSDSPRFSQSSRYYEVIEITVAITGEYTVRSEETLDGMGYLYPSYFNSYDLGYNLLAHDDQSGGNNQFSLRVYLEAGRSYILVFTTYGADVTGRFSIVVSGPGAIRLTHSQQFESASTAAPFQFSTSSMNDTDSNDTISCMIASQYSSELTTLSKRFSRPNGAGGDYYYEAIEVRVNTTGFYTFASEVKVVEFNDVTTVAFPSGNESSLNNSIADAYGCLYESNFQPMSPSMNLYAVDDDSAGFGQFRLTYRLEAHRRYVLVYTTYGHNTIGSFSIKTCGSDYVDLTPINNI